MATTTDQLHILFFPWLAHGHMLPISDMAKLFAHRGVKATIITTPLNAPFLAKALERIQNPSSIKIKIISFPAQEAGLPEGVENFDLVNHETHPKFHKALRLLQGPLEEVIRELKPHALLADYFFPWTTEVASKYAIPRLVFLGSSFFNMCAGESTMKHKPHKNVDSDTEQFMLPDLPDLIKMTRTQLSEHFQEEVPNEITKIIDEAREAERRSYGVIVNSFYELEPAYVNHFRNFIGRKTWHVGPVSLCNRNNEDKFQRGKEASISQQECFKWLDSQKPNTVVYVCFGTTSRISDSQLYEIAMALEACGQRFIWVVRKEKNEEESKENWLPEGFEERIQGKGLIVRGWAPQLLILDHEAIAGFITHCGWNSVLEGVSAGLPMVTWPNFADQFYNEKLVTDVFKIGVPVGVQKMGLFGGDFTRRDAIERAVKEIMIGEKADEMRNRAEALGEMARKAIEEGGSSYSDMGALIQELKEYHMLNGVAGKINKNNVLVH